MESGFKQCIENAKSLTLLYVEDNVGVRAGSMLIFEEFFGSVIEAVDAEDGLEKFKKYPVDLVITDINMPKMSGLEMAERMRKMSPNTPILILSAYNDTPYFVESIRLGVEGYLLKPVEIGQFMEVLSRVIAKIHLQNENQKIQMLLSQYLDVTNKSAIVSKTNKEGVITYVNDAFCSISGFNRHEIIGQKHNIIHHPDMPDDFFEALWKSIKSGNLWQGVIKNRSKSGSSYYVKSAIKPILDIQGEIVEYIALNNDITEIMNPKKQLFDYLSVSKESIVVLFKIENFATIEEFYGNELMELLEKRLSEKLFVGVSSICPFKKIYLLGSGEYAIAIEKSQCPLDVEHFCQKIKEFLQLIESSTIHLNEIEYNVSLLASLAYGGKEPYQSAHYGIKKLEKKRTNFILATNLIVEMQTQAEVNMGIMIAVKEALKSSNIVSHFQPIVDNKTQKIIKFESLVRLINQNGTLWHPSDFLDVSKKGRYYTQITQRVLENSFEALYDTTAGISINLSAVDIEEKATREKIISLLEVHKNEVHRVTFELLEDANVKEFDVIKRFIQEVKERGVNIAIDDFGSGYSNFGRLLDYEPDMIKIDGSLVRNLATDSYSLSIVKTIVGFAKEHQIKTVAEFVEDETIFTILCAIGVDYSQGYYFGKPQLIQAYKDTEGF
ncbi:EAL domain-containing protein [Sulfurospirillum barnesii]|uniref:PAS domain S-box n=1 Tax=Sulfurospirillum barnesii (strain ATCC 700032 / DSM 10660 / SES-3) TaxID=760154 RepID=I3XWR1_SULBS|nr:EAL domain-containing protein [Sulfurospirillum barnesii]AFL68385.1 PAS domain S-box [Sulfurospirillum barnesii SES-3]